ncbi:hypothetical protein F4859DRAFT_378449 [Xylaria cf. heliscus]|nr:hypothetical protein F4859DRAFT_378449 [Xylaria cf. heliscus]
MRVSNLLFSLSAFAAAVSASALPQPPQGRLAKRQTEINTATIPTFNFGPSSTVYLGGGGSTANSTSTRRVSEPAASSTQRASKSATTSQPASGTATSPVDDSETTTTTAAGTAIATATGTIPTYSFFPSSTVPVGGSPTSQPSAGTGSDNRNGNKGGNKGGNTSGNQGGNGTTDGTNNGAGNIGDDSLRQNLADILQGLLDLLGN